MISYHGGVASLTSALISLLALALPKSHAQVHSLTSKACSANQTTLDSTFNKPWEFNATGSMDYVMQLAVMAASQESFVPHWTWSIGVQVLNSSSTKSHYTQALWLDTHGQDLTSDKLGFQMCYLTILGQSQSQEKQGIKDEGDCSAFLGDTCTSAWLKALWLKWSDLKTQNSTQSPCQAVAHSMPSACSQKLDEPLYGCKYYLSCS